MNLTKNNAFELRVRYSDEKGMQLLLYEIPIRNGSQKRKNPKMVSQIGEDYLKFADGAIFAALERSGYRASRISPRRKAPFKLEEEDGIRLNLIFRGISGLKKRSRIEDIILGINSMAREEAYYWHGLLLRDEKRESRNGLKALRTLLGGE